MRRQAGVNSWQDVLAAAGLTVVLAVIYLRSPVYIFGDSQFTLLLGHALLDQGHVRLDEYVAPGCGTGVIRRCSPGSSSRFPRRRGRSIRAVDQRV